MCGPKSLPSIILGCGARKQDAGEDAMSSRYPALPEELWASRVAQSAIWQMRLVFRPKTMQKRVKQSRRSHKDELCQLSAAHHPSLFSCYSLVQQAANKVQNTSELCAKVPVRCLPADYLANNLQTRVNTLTLVQNFSKTLLSPFTPACSFSSSLSLHTPRMHIM